MNFNSIMTDVFDNMLQPIFEIILQCFDLIKINV